MWLLLIGGVQQVVADQGGGDGKRLAEFYGIPRSVWYAIWLAIAVVCLWVGGRLLLGW